MKIKDLKQLVNSLPDEVEVLIEVEKVHNSISDYSLEEVNDYRLVGCDLVLECNTAVQEKVMVIVENKFEKCLARNPISFS